MKIRRLLTIATAIIVLAVIATFAIFQNTQTVQAQYEPARNQRMSFGMVGITSGQTLRVTVADTLTPYDSGWPPGPTRVVITFRGINGQLLRDARTGEVIRRQVDLERGKAAFLDLDYDILPPGPSLAQVRAIIVCQMPEPEGGTQPPDAYRMAATIEVINNANGRTQFVLTNPAVIRGFNPQPDPPIE